MTKVCSKCGESKSIDQYYKAKNRGDGYRPSCKACDYTPVTVDKRKELLPDLLCNVCKVRKPRGDFYGKLGKEDPRCKPCMKERNKGRKRNRGKEANRRHDHSRRAATKADKWHYDLVGYFYPACVACDATEDLTIDHIMPLALGGLNDITNFQLLCRSCNSKKGATYALYERPVGKVVDSIGF